MRVLGFLFTANVKQSLWASMYCFWEVNAMRKWIIIVAVLGAAGCATPAERAARWQAEVDIIVTVYGPACEKLGYKPDTDHWRDCVLRLSERDERRYTRSPRASSCFGHRGGFHCTTL